MRFVHRPTEIDALRWTGDNLAELIDAYDDVADLNADEGHGGALWATGRGNHSSVLPIPLGSWLSRNPRTGVLTCIPHAAIEALYERVPA